MITRYALFEGTLHDGHAQRDDLMPPTAWPRRVWAGSTFFWKVGDPLRVGEHATRLSRIESITPAHHLHISESTWQLVQDYVETVAREPVYLKGKEKPVKIFAVVRKKKGVASPLESS